MQRSVGESENDPNEGSVVANGGRVGDRAAVRDEIGLFQSLLPLRPPVLFYDVFERDRVVIRQGDVGYSFYFIVSGSVLVEIQDKDPFLV